MISVVILLYNKQAYIAEAINSVLTQSFRNFELIIIDDGSTDGSLSIVEAFNEERIQLTKQVHSGVSEARNTGIKKAKYPWIALLDADDWWAPHFLNEIVGAMQKFPDQLIFASGRSRVFDTVTERYSNTLLPDDGETELLNYFQIISRHLPPMNSSNTVISKPLLLEKGLFRKEQQKHEDHDLWLRLTTDHPVVFVNRELSFYRKLEATSVVDSGYAASDFTVYLNTLKEVKGELTETDKGYFGTYINSFVTLTYLKYYGNYSRLERKAVINLIKKLVSAPQRMLFAFLKIVPFNVYPVLKFLRR